MVASQQPVLSLSILEYQAALDDHLTDIRKIFKAGIDCLHLDIMRQDFVAQDAFSSQSISKLIQEFIEYINFDIHLMLAQPQAFIKQLTQLIPNNLKQNTLITLHYEILGADHTELINQIKQAGFKVGLALNPQTQLNQLTQQITNLIDLILIMTVQPGQGGQKFKSDMLSKIKLARHQFPQHIIQVDGGINSDTAPLVIQSGANNLVIGSYITRAPHPIQIVKNLKALI